VQGNKQVTRAAIEFYGPDRAKWLGAFPSGRLRSASFLRQTRASALPAVLQQPACVTSLLAILQCPFFLHFPT